MLLMGTSFLTLGFFIILNEKYTIEKINNEINLIKKPQKVTFDTLTKYKMFLCIFAIILGVFCIVDYIVF